MDLILIIFGAILVFIGGVVVSDDTSHGIIIATLGVFILATGVAIIEEEYTVENTKTISLELIKTEIVGMDTTRTYKILTKLRN